MCGWYYDMEDSKMFIADVEVKFDDGSTGARQFTSKNRDGVYAKVDNFLNRLVHYPNHDNELSQLIAHKVHVYEDGQLEWAGQVLQSIQKPQYTIGLGDYFQDLRNWIASVKTRKGSRNFFLR